MTSPLFRAAAVVRQSERFDGVPLPALALPHRSLVWWLAFCTLTGLVWLALGTYQRKVTVTGTLEPDGGVLELAAPQAGSLTRLLVGIGEQVAAGQPLFVIDSSHVLEDGGMAEAGTLAALQVQEDGLRRQLAIEDQLQHAMDKAHADKVRLLHLQQAQWEAGTDRQQQSLAVRQAQLDRATRLVAQGMLARAELDTVQVQSLQQQQAVADAQQQAVATGAALAAAEAEHASQRLRSRQQREQVAAQLAQLQQQRLQTAAQFRRVVVAPVAGHVTAVSLKQGTAVQAQQPVLGLMPEASQLQAELHVPSQAIGFVRAGQHVQLRLDAFPYQKFGPQAATVGEMPGSPELGGRGAPAYFRLVAAPAKQTVTAYGREMPLRPGMAFSADITVDHRSLLEWLLEPLYSLRGH